MSIIISTHPKTGHRFLTTFLRYVNKNLEYYVTLFQHRTGHIYNANDLSAPVLHQLALPWRRSSVVRTSVFPRPAPDLWLTDDHFVGKLSTVGQPSRPTQPSTHLWSANE